MNPALRSNAPSELGESSLAGCFSFATSQALGACVVPDGPEAVRTEGG